MPLRYNEDYSYLKDSSAYAGNRLDLGFLKYIPVDETGDKYLSIGGEVRYQYEVYDNQDFGVADEDDNGYLLQRYMLHADFHAGESFRLFGQLKSNWASFQSGPRGPADEDRLDLHQAFLDFVPTDSLTLRIGRQELLYGNQRLVSVREGPNVRRTFDAIRALASFEAWQVDGFYSRPVETNPGTFDDGRVPGEQFWGVYGTWKPDRMHTTGLDVYYLGLGRRDADFNQGTADERRHSVGTRCFGSFDNLDWDLEAVLQWGHFGDGDIRAWTLATDVGWTFGEAALAPRAAIRLSFISGDRDGDDSDLQTFNPLFPRGKYFGESATLGPLNVIDVHPMLRLTLAEGWSLESGWGFFWRTSNEDGVYGNGPNLILSDAGSDAAFIGSEVSILLSVVINRHISLSTSYSRFFDGTFLREVGPGKDMEYFSIVATYLF